MKKMRTFTAAAVSSMAILSTVLLSGCGNVQDGNGKALTEKGTLLLSVNPKIEIEYDQNGKVVALAGKNDDGSKVVDAYQDYVGKECEDVLEDLIEEIHEAGYFEGEVDGNKKTVVLQMQPGSVLPEADFLQKMGESTQDAVKNLKLTSGLVTIDDDDYDEKYGKDSSYITLEKAKEIALTQANVNAEDAVFQEKEFDLENGKEVYELEFTANGREYEYDIDACSGKILETKSSQATEENQDTDYGPDNDGVTDYDDTDYGPNNDGVTDYDDTDYGPNNDGVTNYDDTDYGPNNDGVTDYDDTDYGPNNDGVTDYDNTDYGPNNDGVTDYDDTDYNAPAATPAPPVPAPAPQTPAPTPAPSQPVVTPDDDGASDYDDGASNYDDGASDYDNGASNYDDGASDYDD